MCPMGFPCTILSRPRNERPYLLIPVQVTCSSTKIIAIVRTEFTATPSGAWPLSAMVATRLGTARKSPS
jgi:hypothetical protein